MNNQEYKEYVKQKMQSLTDLTIESYAIGRGVIGETLFKEDLFTFAILNRFVTLTEGFKTLILERNLTCCGALLRLQLDNCMRLYGLSIAEDIDKAIDTIMDGGRFDKLKDKQGKKMKDAYLKKQLSIYDSKFKTVYDATSGYIHFSNKGIFQSVRPTDDNKVRLQMTNELSDEFNPILVECLDAYIYFSKLFLNMFDSIIESKREYDERHKEVV